MIQTILEIIDIVGFVIALVSIIYMAGRKASVEQKLMLLVVTCIFVYEFGAVKLLNSPGPEAAFAFFQLQYFGMAFLPMLFVIFVSRYLALKLPMPAALVLLADGALVLWLATNRHSNDLIFTNVRAEYLEGVNYIAYDPGPMLYAHGLVLTACVLYATVFPLRKLLKCHDKLEQKRISAIILVTVIVGLSYTIQWSMMPAHINIMPLMFAVANILLIVNIERFDLFSVVSTARDRVFESMRDAVMLVDESGKLQDYNLSAASIFPNLEEYKGQPLPKEYAFMLENPEKELELEQGDYSLERHMTPVFYRGKLLGYCLVFADVTRIRQMYMDLEQLKVSADAANQSKSSFLANMSHEIRTPMNAIMGYSELLLKERLNHSSREYVRSIRNSSNSLLHIINDILDFSKIESGKLELVEEDYATDSLFKEIEDVMRIQARNKGLNLVFSTAPDIPAVLNGDRTRVRQILVNIINNSIKYTREGGVRVIGEWQKQEGLAELLIIVADTGIGIKPEDRDKLFEQFERLEQNKNSGIEGAGLGLNITKALLKLMGGTINIESEYGVGTSVVVTIPQRIVEGSAAAQLERSMGGADKSHQIPMGHDVRILVVDDNMVNLVLMQNCLKQYNIIPDIADGGRKSVEMASHKKYDIIFMDQMMPEMDGIAAMKAIRSLSNADPDQVIIALTANAIAGTRNLLIGEGFTDYVSKPMPLGTLEQMLITYLPEEKVSYKQETSKASDRAEEGRKDRSYSQQTAEIKSKVFALPDYIDQEKGMANSGDDPDQYRETISIVYKYSAEKLDRLEYLWKQKEYADYTIEVHALKSNAATVGAAGLAESCLRLEMAGKEGRFDEIDDNTAGLITAFRGFVEDLGAFLAPYEGAAQRAADKVGDQTGLAEAQPAVSEPVKPNSNPAKKQIQQKKPREGESEFINSFYEIAVAVKEDRPEDALDLIDMLSDFELPPVIGHAWSLANDYAKAGSWKALLELCDKMIG